MPGVATTQALLTYCTISAPAAAPAPHLYPVLILPLLLPHVLAVTCSLPPSSGHLLTQGLRLCCCRIQLQPQRIHLQAASSTSLHGTSARPSKRDCCPPASVQHRQRRACSGIASRQAGRQANRQTAASHLVVPPGGLHLPPQGLLPQLCLQLQRLRSLEQQLASALLQSGAELTCCLVATLAGLLGLPVRLIQLRLQDLRRAQ